MNEELLKIHNSSISIIKDVQEGNFANTNEYQWNINRSVKVITSLHNKKLKRDADARSEYINANYF